MDRGFRRKQRQCYLVNLIDDPERVARDVQYSSLIAPFTMLMGRDDDR